MNSESKPEGSELDELEPLLETAAPAGPGPSPSGAPATPAERPALRPLEQSPLHLRKAALVVAAASLVPWVGHDVPFVQSLLAKLVILLGMYLWWCAIAVRAGEIRKVPGPLATLGKLRFVLPALAGLVVLAGLSPLVDGGGYTKHLTEKGILALAAATWVHIYGYERWGKFNPIFPLMFLAPAAGGILSAIGRARGEDWLGVAGATGVAFGGFFAVYTIVEAMRQAKTAGELKKKQAFEERRRVRRENKA